MKKFLLLFLTICSLYLLSGCSIKENKLDNALIYTTIYPVEYITKYLYGDSSTIESIYPVGVNLKEYVLTEKQIETYAKGDLFVYIGLNNEKNISKSFINKNKNMLLIDATYGLNSSNVTELWLAPNNFLMLAKNIKTSLNEYLNNTVMEDNVNVKYDELYKNVSWIDAELRNIAEEAKENGKNTLVVANNALKFLEGYGFSVISLEDLELSGSQKAILDVKNNFQNSNYTTVLKLKSEENSSLLSDIEKAYKVKIVEINDLITNPDSASDYISIQYENISLIRDIIK